MTCSSKEPFPPAEFEEHHHKSTVHAPDQSPSHGSIIHSNDISNMDSLIDYLYARPIEDSTPMRKLGVMFKDLCVVGLDRDTAIQHNVASYFHPRAFIKYINTLRHPPLREIISGFEGVVLPGEMLLVLGRPGSGCSTLLKTLANHREEYRSVLGDVFYDSFTSEEIQKRYRGDVLYCPDEDVHYPTLTVRETLEFASMMRTPCGRMDSQSRKSHAADTAKQLMHTFGLEHVEDTITGNASIRGISDGEKKKVSIAEAMSARGRLVCWDNSTRDLDSSAALEFVRVLRSMTDTAKMTTVVSVCRAGEQLFNLFDKVCIINEGKMAYFGPTDEARQYFINMGYEPQNRQSTPDFLVASTNPDGRKIRHGFKAIIPRTAEEMAVYFRESIYGQRNRSLIDSYQDLYVGKPDLRRAYDASVASERARDASNKKPYILSKWMRVRVLMRRRWQVVKGDWITQIFQLGAQIVASIFVGMAFFQMPSDDSAYFSRGGVLCVALLYSAVLSLAEIPSLFFQRPIVLRHYKGGLYSPFVEGLAHTIVDIPISFVSITVSLVILYFMAGLQNTAQQFFTFLLFMLIMVPGMKASFRGAAASCRNESASIGMAGVITLIQILYSGYPIFIQNIPGGLRWLIFINSFYYALWALIVNEFHTVNVGPTTLVPAVPGDKGITPASQVRVTVGTIPGMGNMAPGDIYAYATFGFSYSNLWINLSIVFIATLCALTIFFLNAQYNKRAMRDDTVTLYKDTGNGALTNRATDEEKVAPGDLCENRERSHSIGERIRDDSTSEKSGKVDIFTWNDIQCELPIPGGKMRKLLDNVSGYVAPGTLTALMGDSGAGKTLLLDALAQRTSDGVVRGDCFVDGQPLPVDFASQIAYVQQMDTQIPQSTVREALLFSAQLRQPACVPMAEKEAYVDKCLKMCGMEAHADAIVGTLGPEHRKRTSIGVELAAKPKLLLFLDEPTSGLDSQSACAIMNVLRKLADNGQAILCTIYQPSSELFQVFDRLLLLQNGGQTVYFGDIGKESMTMIEYFERNGAPRCAADANPAEYMMHVIGAGATTMCTTDWGQVWKDSPEAANLEHEIERIHREGRSRPVDCTGPRPEFATSWMRQLALLTHRGFVCHWRNLTYIYSKLIICVVTGLLVGFTFYGLRDNSLRGCAGKLYSLFMVVLFSIPMAYHLQGKFIEYRTVYEVRERPSRMFSWSAFLVSQILLEIPWNILCMSLLFICWYWSSGFDTSRAGFSYLFCCVVFPLYYITLGQGAAAISPNGTIAATVAGTSSIFSFLFAGVLQRYSELGWMKWMYYLSPFTYFVDGFFGQAMGKQPIICALTELTIVEPSLGMTCAAFMGPYISSAGGYVMNPNATAECAYCPFRTTDEYMRTTFNVASGYHWRDLGIVLEFVAFNILFMFAGMYLFRIRKGIWRLFRPVGAGTA